MADYDDGDPRPFFDPRPCATCGQVFRPTLSDLRRKQRHIQERGKWSFSDEWPRVCPGCVLKSIMSYEGEQ